MTNLTDIAQLSNTIEITPISWDGIPIHIPKFEIYAIIPNPVLTGSVEIDGKSVPLLVVEKYQVPVIEPFGGVVSTAPPFVIVLSHFVRDEFSLYAYPADNIEETYVISYQEWLSEHAS
jgi:hypothetical protein